MAAGPADAAQRGYYVYGLIGSDVPTLADVHGVDGTSPVFVVEQDGVGAIVSEVPLDEFGEAALQQKLEELPWVEEKVRAHESVLERVAQDAPVLPLRFGTIYRSLDRLRSLLAERRSGLVSALEQLRGRREWGVKCLVEKTRLAEAVEGSDAQAAELAEDAKTKPAGSAYLARKKLERYVDERADAMAARLAARAHERLAAVADQAVREDGATLKGAYLVHEAREEDFRRILREVGAEGEDVGLRFELTGPWPPYSFVGSATE
jgi:hypothetical protein